MALPLPTVSIGDPAHAAHHNDIHPRLNGLVVNAVGNTGATKTISLASGAVLTFTVNADCVFTMPSGVASGEAVSFTAILTDSGGPRNITFTGVKWSNGSDPTAMSATGAIDIFTFFTIDGGTTWYGYTAGTGMAT